MKRLLFLFVLLSSAAFGQIDKHAWFQKVDALGNYNILNQRTYWDTLAVAVPFLNVDRTTEFLGNGNVMSLGISGNKLGLLESYTESGTEFNTDGVFGVNAANQISIQGAAEILFGTSANQNVALFNQNHTLDIAPGGFEFDDVAVTFPTSGAVATTTQVDAKVEDAINDGVTTIAPSENAVFDALALKATLASANTFTANNVFQPTVTTGTGAMAGLQIAANSLTTGNGLDVSSSSVTSGSIANFTSTTTDINAGNVVRITSSGANANSSRTINGLNINLTNTGASSTNVGMRVNASGASNNYVLQGTGGTLTTSRGSSVINALANEQILARHDQNALTIITASNATSGTAAYAGFVAMTDATYTNTISMRAFSAGFTTSGIQEAGNGVVMSSLPLNIGTTNSNDVTLWTNGTVKATLTAAGDFGVAASPTSTLYVNGSFGTAYAAKTGAYTLTATDHLIEVTSGTHTQTLPTAVGIAGRKYIITNSGSGTVTVGTTSSQTFVNVSATPTTLTLNQFQTVIVISNGSNWLRVSTI